jgi:hypothetical protein
MIVAAIWEEIDDEAYYRFLGAVAVGNVLLVLLQPVLRRLGGAPAPPRQERPRGDTFRLVFKLKGIPAQRAVDEAVKALERGGAHVENVERLP